MASREIVVRVADLPQVQALLEDLERRVAAAEAVVEAARAWRAARDFTYRPSEINPHLLTAHHEDLVLAAAVDALDGAS